MDGRHHLVSLVSRVSLAWVALAFAALPGTRSLGAESRDANAGAEAGAAAGSGAGVAPRPKLRLYARLLDPREHPDYDRRHVKPPTWDTFGNRTRFACLRGFEVKDDLITGFEAEIDKYTRTHALGDVVWPSYPILFAKNLPALAEEIRKRDLFLFDIWGFVPGSGEGGYWKQFRPPPEALAMLEATLGERWLGMDVGEQDGRYVGGYASQAYPTAAGRFEQYLHFRRHFARMYDDLGNRMAALVSLNFGHYFLKEGVYTLLGAETAQALPNGQVYYSFIRGAGKQYGVPWFGNASIFNRWGWKAYGGEGADGGYRFGPSKGTSLSLLKRLLYSHILYNCVLVGFENGWFEGDRLSPIGRIQEAAVRWVKENGPPGVMVCPVALLLDFRSGWSFPRHLYTGDLYRVWGNLPYEAGDYLTDGVLDALYPGYQDASYFHDESGFVAPTPHGDTADVLLTDAPSWLLRRYAVVVVAGEISGGKDILDRLVDHASAGGRVVITAGNLRKFADGMAGFRVTGPATRFPAGTKVEMAGTTFAETAAMELCPIDLPARARVLAHVGGQAAAAEAPCGSGSILVLASPFGIAGERAGPATSEIDRPLGKPYPLLAHVRAVLDLVFGEAAPFDLGTELSWIACRKEAGEYVVGVANPGLRPLPFALRPRGGELESIEEIPLDESEKGAVGYLPEGFETAPIGKSTMDTVTTSTSDTSARVGTIGTIAGGDLRIVRVKLRRDDSEEIPHVTPPPRPRGRFLVLRDTRSIEEDIVARPTFFEHFDGVVIDWSYLRSREKATLEKEAGWIRRQGLRVAADLTSGIDLYPDLRLIDNVPADYEASLAAIRDVIGKLATLGGRDLILSLHRHPENNFTAEETVAGFDAALRTISACAAESGIAVHLRVYPGRPPWSLGEALAVLSRVGAPNLRLAPSTAPILAAGSLPQDLLPALSEKVGFWMLGTPIRDAATGAVWSAHGPVAGFGTKLREVVGAASGAAIAFDALYRDADEEVIDAREMAPGPTPARSEPEK